MLKIEFEGVDGSGKTTGLKYFIEQALKRGLSAIETREVGNPNVPSAIKMREFVLDPNSNLTGQAMELIFSAMRYENDAWLSKLATSGNAPDLVVSDRGWLSHLSYTDHNVSPEFTGRLYKGLMEATTQLPNIVIYFRVDTETALKRRIKRGEGMDVIEMKGIEFQNKVRDSFDKYIAELVEKDQVLVLEVNANQELSAVKAQLDVILNQLSSGQLDAVLNRISSGILPMSPDILQIKKAL